VSDHRTFAGMHLLGFSINMLTMFRHDPRDRPGRGRRHRVVEKRRGEQRRRSSARWRRAKQAMTEIRRRADLHRAGAAGRVPAVAFTRRGHRHALQAGSRSPSAISMVISGIMALTLSPAARRHHHQDAPRREEPPFVRSKAGFRAAAERIPRRSRANAQGVADRVVAYGLLIAGIW